MNAYNVLWPFLSVGIVVIGFLVLCTAGAQDNILRLFAFICGHPAFITDTKKPG
jgi:hypothetical protein